MRGPQGSSFDRLLQDPCQIHVGRVDRDYCAYLAALEDRGELHPDRPRSAAEMAHRQDLARRLVSGKTSEDPKAPENDLSVEPTGVEVVPSVTQRLRRRIP